MRVKKRMLSTLLALLLLCSMNLLTLTAGAAGSTPERELQAKALCAMGLFQGYDETGTNFGLDDGVTREQALIFLIRMLGEDKAARAWTGASPYTDVPSDNWALPYVGYAQEKGYTVGMGDGKFGLGGDATMRQMTTFALRGLAYSDAEDSKDFTYQDCLSFAVSKGILHAAKEITPFTRGEAVVILYNTLGADVKGEDYDLLFQLMEQDVVTQEQYENAQTILGENDADSDTGIDVKLMADRYNSSAASYNGRLKQFQTLGLDKNVELTTLMNDMTAELSTVGGMIAKGTLTDEQATQCTQALDDLDGLIKVMDAAIKVALDSITMPLTIVNKTGVDLNKLFVSPTEKSDWDDNLLAETLKKDKSGSIELTFPKDSPLWDVQIVDKSGNEIDFVGIDFSKCNSTGATLTLEYNQTSKKASYTLEVK